MTHVRSGEIAVAEPLYQFVNDQVLPGTGVEADAFWKGLSDYLTAFAPRNRALLDKRDMLQARIDEWHRTNPWPFDAAAYAAFLRARSDEHTSELQSLLRISYAVFCLKHKK